MVRKGTKAMCHSPFTKKEQNKCQRQTPNAMRILNNLILKKTGQSPSQTTASTATRSQRREAGAATKHTTKVYTNNIVHAVCIDRRKFGRQNKRHTHAQSPGDINITTTKKQGAAKEQGGDPNTTRYSTAARQITYDDYIVILVNC